MNDVILLIPKVVVQDKFIGQGQVDRTTPTAAVIGSRGPKLKPYANDQANVSIRTEHISPMV